MNDLVFDARIIFDIPLLATEPLLELTKEEESVSGGFPRPSFIFPPHIIVKILPLTLEDLY